MDFGTAAVLLPDGLPELISPVLPEGLCILDAYLPERKFSDIVWVEVHGTLHYEKGAPQRASQLLTELFSADSIVISKKTKRGVSDVDIAPYIKEIEFSQGDAVSVSARLSAQDPSVSPDNLLSAIGKAEGLPSPDLVLFTRMEVYSREQMVFM